MKIIRIGILFEGRNVSVLPSLERSKTVVSGFLTLPDGPTVVVSVTVRPLTANGPDQADIMSNSIHRLPRMTNRRTAPAGVLGSWGLTTSLPGSDIRTS